jgi:hypothetical protein
MRKVALMAVAAASLFAATRLPAGHVVPEASAQPFPVVPPVCEPPPAPPVCDSTCVNSVTVVRQWSASAGACVTWFAYPCEPYDCDDDGRTCRTSCVSDVDCSQGALCDTATGRCTTGPTVCSDAFTVEQANGAQQSCAPYRCVAGTCMEHFDGIGGCAPGFQCVGRDCVAQ